MPADDPPARPTEEQSIRSRKAELFDHDGAALAPAGPRKPFVEYLRTTPPEPLAGWVKALLWAAGLAAVLLFVAALLKAPKPAPKPAPAPAEAPGG